MLRLFCGVLFCLIFLSSCSSTGSASNVYPAPGGSFRIFAEKSRRFAAQEEALNGADQHCRGQGKQVKIIRETISSDSSHREKVRRDAERASKSMEIFSGDTEEAKRIKDIGQALPAGSNYRAEVIFECQ